MKMNSVLMSMIATVVMVSTASADICGIVSTAKGRTAANLIKAQIEQNVEGKTATLMDDSSGEQYEVTRALVTNKNGYELGDGDKYFDFYVFKKGQSQRQTIDIGHAYLLLNKGQTFVSLEHLTGCANFGQIPFIDNVPRARAE